MVPVAEIVALCFWTQQVHQVVEPLVSELDMPASLVALNSDQEDHFVYSDWQTSLHEGQRVIQ